MKDYIQYHKRDAEKQPPAEVSPQDFYIYTNKNMPQVVGNRVWLIAGEGRPRRYTLAEVFIADQFLPARHPDFLHEIRGSQGWELELPPDLTHLPWFRELLRVQGSFAFGLSALPARFVPLLEQLAEWN